ncbi:DUF3459 domain-containing protein, partial [Roseicyclus sp.]|uniref:DUF3459 domain-containing protein n=1 Tax=Roseicyclus sp. TaxID=1914329 RepID=UPI003F9EDDDB
ALRREMPLIRHGSYMPHLEDHPAIFAYSRALDGTVLTVVANMGDAPVEKDMRDWLAQDGEILVATRGRPDLSRSILTLAPWESFAILGTGRTD